MNKYECGGAIPMLLTLTRPNVYNGNTELLYLADSKVSNAHAVVTAIHGNWASFDRTIFCPHSHEYLHPQPGDDGFIEVNGITIPVTALVLQGGEILHELKGTIPQKGAEVLMRLSWHYRLKSMKLHTGMHLLVGALKQLFNADPLVGNHKTEIMDGFGQVYVPQELHSDNVLKKLEKTVNQFIQNERKITVSSIEASQLSNYDWLEGPRVKKLVGQKSELRMVTIESLGSTLCDGTFFSHTGEIDGHFEITTIEAKKSGTKIIFQIQ